jgi:hypothetical protein
VEKYVRERERDGERERRRERQREKIRDITIQAVPKVPILI